MEDGLVPTNQTTNIRLAFVLILIVMEDGLVHDNKKSNWDVVSES